MALYPANSHDDDVNTYCVCCWQKALMRAHASLSLSSGTVNTTRKKLGYWKHCNDERTQWYHMLKCWWHEMWSYKITFTSNSPAHRVTRKYSFDGTSVLNSECTRLIRFDYGTSDCIKIPLCIAVGFFYRHLNVTRDYSPRRAEQRQTAQWRASPWTRRHSPRP